MNDFLNPVFENKIGICFCCDNNYLPYLSVAVNSLIENSSSDFDYDIVVFCSDVDEKSQRAFIAFYERKNVSIRFLDVTPYVEKFGEEKFYTRSYYTIAMYYRFFIPDILQNYKQVVYCDCDIIFEKDIKELCLSDVKDNLLGVCIDPGALIRFKKDTDIYRLHRDNFKINDYEKYFNSGILVYNVKACLEFNFLEKCAKKTIELNSKLVWPDQDVLNVVCQEQVMILDQKFNVQMYAYKDNKVKYIELKEEYIKMLELAFDDMAICHYAAAKPWKNVYSSCGDKWWEYARKSPIFYEKILLENLVYPKINNLEKQIKDLNNEIKFLKNLLILSAKDRILNRLSYKLGKAMIENSSSFWGVLKMPFVLLKIAKSHKIPQNQPNIKTLPDYNEAIKYKNHLSYKLGVALIKGFKTWYKGGIFLLPFEIQKIKKEHKKK